MSRRRHMTRCAAACAAWWIVAATTAVAADGSARHPSTPEPMATSAPADVLRLGERMFREGILPSGAPMQAIAANDIPVDGRALTCANCHLRSGMGVLEGTVVSAPITGPRLYAPQEKIDIVRSAAIRKRLPEWFWEAPARSAYTDETLARAIRSGENPDGRALNAAMPRFPLDDGDMAILTTYLKDLSAARPPGVSDTTLHFATVIADDVPDADRDAMLGPLQAFARTWGKGRMYRDSRDLSLSIWRLHGPPSTWRTQLEAYADSDPVFALLGGITAGSWAPIHEFCEAHRIPALFPVTPFPVVSDHDWYTLYYSRGLAEEGVAAAHFLNGRIASPATARVLEVVGDTPADGAVARGFADAWRAYGHAPPQRVVLDGATPDPDLIGRVLLDAPHATAVLLWLGADQIASLRALAAGASGPDVMVSAGLLADRLGSLPEEARGRLYVTYPRLLPAEATAYETAVRSFMRNFGVPVTNLDISAQMFALFLVLSEPLGMMREDVSREYLLELIDMQPDLSTQGRNYPRLSFGRGQRYASKGTYVVQLGPGSQPEITARSDWVIR